MAVNHTAGLLNISSARFNFLPVFRTISSKKLRMTFFGAMPSIPGNRAVLPPVVYRQVYLDPWEI